MKLLVLPVLVTVWLLSHTTQAKSPILLLHGITGSMLFVRDSTDSCSTRGRFERLWVGARLVTCGRREMGLDYNPRTRRFSDRPGVTVRVQDFGETSSVEALDRFGLIRYFHNFVSHFVNRGYQCGRSIRAAPYDWRLAADELERRGYFANLRDLVQTMYRDNGNRKVTMVVHSMGGLVAHHFLTRYSGINQRWKDTHINAFVTLSGAWSGGVSVLGSVISGKRLFGDMNALNAIFATLFVPVARTFPSLSWLLPRPDVFRNQVLVRVGNREYRASDYQQLFNQIEYPNGFQMHQNLLQSVTPNFLAPNVPTHCLYGIGVDTPLTYVYDNLNRQPREVRNGDGDGTVNVVSSQVCLRWGSMRGHSFRSQTFRGVGHMGIVSDRQVLRYIEGVVGVSRMTRFKGVLLDILRSQRARQTSE